jgi:hypothetical protein
MSRKAKIPVLVAACCLVSALHLYAAQQAGVTMADTAQVGNTTLVLNGMGVRTKIVVKVYVAGLYLPRKSSDAEGIVKADAPKRLVMQFVRDVSKKQITEAFTDSFNENAPEAKKTEGVNIEKFLVALESVKDGDQMIFTYIPDQGTTFAINGKDKLTIPGLGFSQALFSVWLGPKPPTGSLKKGLLGQ